MIVHEVEFAVPMEITLPFGYVVHVRPVSARRLKREGCGEPGAVVACWDADEKTVWIREDQDEKATIEAFAHELPHVAIDWQRWVLQTIGAIK